MSIFDPISEFNTFNRNSFVKRIAGQVPAGARVLDAGAGPCAYRPLFSHCTYEAQDFARYTGPEHRYGSLDYVCDITAIPVEDAAFDCVICTEVLEHVPRPDRAVAELSRILKPGGILALSAPLVSGIHMAPFHFYGGFTPYWYQHFLTTNGLAVESCSANGGFFLFYGQESRRFLHMMTPKNRVGKILFFPFKAFLAIWFRVLMPLACHFLDKLDPEPELTVGYFVVARKYRVPVAANGTKISSD